VQQSCDGLIFVPTRLQNQSAYAYQMSNVGDGRAFSGLLMMQPRSELQRQIEAPSQKW